jgi:hypothetical protein
VPTSLTPAERSLRASVAAHSRWSQTPAAERRRQADRGHAALLAKFATQVDPDGVLAPEERDKLARNAYTAHMKRLALASSRARRKGAANQEAA